MYLFFIIWIRYESHLMIRRGYWRSRPSLQGGKRKKSGECREEEGGGLSKGMSGLCLLLTVTIEMKTFTQCT